jgi:Rha family phage regulatory protein
MYDLTIIKQNNGCYIDSREVAEIIGKQHKHLLRDIRGYCEILEKSIKPKVGLNEFFLESSYIDPIGRTLPCYLLSKMGCELVANKLTGEKGVLFTAAYVAKFNEMEQKERAELEARGATPQLRAFNTAIRNVLAGYTNTAASGDEIMGFLEGAYKPFGVEVIREVGKHHLSATAIAWMCNVFSRTGRPHSRAVAAIIEKLNIAPEHKAILPYGLVGISMRYDDYVLAAVRKWLAENNNPRDIPYLNFYYHICYERQFSLLDNKDYLFSSENHTVINLSISLKIK